MECQRVETAVPAHSGKVESEVEAVLPEECKVPGTFH
jgi:hypothetical protein